MRRSLGIAVVCVALAAGVPGAAQSAPRAAAEAPAPAPAVFELPPGLPEVPAELQAMLARERASAGGSNAMWMTTFVRRHKAYEWGLAAVKETPSAKTRLVIGFARTEAQGTQVQASRFWWMLGSGALRMDADLKPASLETGDGMGSNGSISMRLADPGRLFRFRPEDCTGSYSYRIARFGGRFRFNARDEYFGKLEPGRLRVFLWRDRDLKCDSEDPSPASRFCPELSFGMIDAENGVAVTATRTDQGAVDQTVMVRGKSGDADTEHLISVGLAVPEAFTASDDGTSATIDGDAAGPWISGALSYVAPPGAAATDDCGPYRLSTGIATGDYTAHFDSIGSVTPATTGLAAALRRDL